MKSTPFMITVPVPVDVQEGDVHIDKEGNRFKIKKT
jgi:hypothetical protein